MTPVALRHAKDHRHLDMKKLGTPVVVKDLPEMRVDINIAVDTTDKHTGTAALYTDRSFGSAALLSAVPCRW